MAMTRREKTTKGEATRSRILEVALGIFRERGHEATTMRAIADAAGVALGSAYYYFPSKEHLIQGFYLRSHEEHVAASQPALEAKRSLKDRLLAVLSAKLETIEPYHEFGGVLFRTASDPNSPLNPFSDASRGVRRAGIAFYGDVIEGSTTSIPKDLKQYLPDLLWTFEMGVVLYWIHDRSPGRENTWKLMERSVSIIDQLIRLASSSALRGPRRRVIKMLDEIGLPMGSSTEPTEGSS
jgi:AcrR family transcriptional regulator